MNRVEKLREATEWREERTGLHEYGFIETRRHWFTGVAAIVPSRESIATPLSPDRPA
ncbi:MAG TPA: hypothetical protein VMU05_04880 [Dongiaceae bacterium]|nr:hypothetical protein [Dongiaceae bacterium]